MTSRGCMCAWKDDRKLQRHKGSGKGPNKGCRNSPGPTSFGPTVIWGPKWITTHLCMSRCAHSRGIYCNFRHLSVPVCKQWRPRIFHWNSFPETLRNHPIWQSPPVSLPPCSQRRNKKTSEPCRWGTKLRALCAAATALQFHKVSDRGSGALFLRIASSPAAYCRHCKVAA